MAMAPWTGTLGVGALALAIIHKNDHPEGNDVSKHASGFRFQRSVLALMIAAAGSSAVPAAAQGGRASTLEEVVVTAQRREESLQDTPISITAFTPDRIADLGIHNVTDIGEFAPNISIAKQPGSNVSLAIYIRGVGSAESSVVNDPKVGVYVDGVYVSKAVGGVFDVVDLERVEVLRGPQGTLFGRNTTGGAVNITTKKPTGEFGLKANGTVGNYDSQRYGLRIDLPEYYNVAANLSVNHFQTDGWADNRYDGAGISSLQSDIEDTVASEDNWAYRLALRWRPLDSVTVDYAFDRTDNEGVPSPFQLTGVRTELFNGFTRRPFPFATLGGSLYQQMAAQVGDPDDRKKNLTLDNSTLEWTDIDGHTVNAAWEVNDALTFKYIFGYRYTDNGNTGSDTDGGTYYARDLFYGVLRGNNGEIQSPGFSGVTSKNHVDAKTHELQFIGNLFDERLFYTGGLYYFDETTQQDNPQTFSLPIALVAPRSPALPALPGARLWLCAARPGGTAVRQPASAVPGQRSRHPRFRRLPLWAGIRVMGGVRAVHLRGHGILRPHRGHPLHGGRQGRVASQRQHRYRPRHPRHADRQTAGRRPVGQHQLRRERQLQHHGRRQRLPEVLDRLQRGRLQRARDHGVGF
ncbi:MAG: TonB-dependent receptor plug domain-containing protein [Gammaproteobacteria bacterium]|nr:TonB-dependent receptor plug domain-containing protein [Gammaproteobacteria bacterium]